MTQLIAVGNTATTFAAGEFPVAAGTTVEIHLKGSGDGPAPAGVDFELAFKASANNYVTIATLNASNYVQQGAIQGGSTNATYALRRLASAAGSAGADYV